MSLLYMLCIYPRTMVFRKKIHQTRTRFISWLCLSTNHDVTWQHNFFMNIRSYQNTFVVCVTLEEVTRKCQRSTPFVHLTGSGEQLWKIWSERTGSSKTSNWQRHAFSNYETCYPGHTLARSMPLNYIVYQFSYLGYDAMQMWNKLIECIFSTNSETSRPKWHLQDLSHRRVY